MPCRFDVVERLSTSQVLNITLTISGYVNARLSQVRHPLIDFSEPD